VANAASVVGTVVAVDEFVEFVQGFDFGDGYEVVAAEAADIAFHTALFVCAVDAGLAVERVDVEVGAKRHPAVGFHPLAGEADHLGDGGFEVVVADLAGRHTAEGLERVNVASAPAGAGRAASWSTRPTSTPSTNPATTDSSTLARKPAASGWPGTFPVRRLCHQLDPPGQPKPHRRPAHPAGVTRGADRDDRE
jgi:hypothetical protein